MAAVVEVHGLATSLVLGEMKPIWARHRVPVVSNHSITGHSGAPWVNMKWVQSAEFSSTSCGWIRSPGLCTMAFG
jgi:hypothetical protein